MTRKLRLPPGCKNVTAKELSTVFALIGATAVVRALKRPERLEDLTEEERDIVLAVLAQHPKLTVDKAIEALREAGM
jgi:hypothetical protein